MLILLVDDNPNDRALARRALQAEIPGAVFHEVGTSEGLDAVLAGTRPEVAVIDYSLGWADGLEVFRRIHRSHPDCGVVMFTGSLGEEAAVDVMRMGIDDYIIKDPARLPRLVASVAGLLRQARDRYARRRAEARHAALHRSASVGMFTCRADGGLLETNPAMRRMLGVDPDADVTALNIFDLLRAEGLRAAWDGADGPAIQGLEVAFAHMPHSALLDAHTVREADGEVEGVLTDVTALRAAIDRGNSLLREVYHRVYNNLQVVDAFLGLQARRFSDPQVKSGFREVAERIRALALIQQRLHRGNDFEALEFAGYLQDLVASLNTTHGRLEIRVTLDLQPVRLPIDRAIPLGLIATETLINAYKHAFPEGRSGNITVAFSQGAEGIVLAISDDGVGAPAEIYGAASSSGGGIGWRVVPQLVQQLGAKLRISTQGGTTIVLKLPVPGQNGAS